MKCNEQMIFKSETFKHVFRCELEKNHSGPHHCGNNIYELIWKYRDAAIREDLLRIFRESKEFNEFTNKILFIDCKIATERGQIYRAVNYLLKHKLIKKVAYDRYKYNNHNYNVKETPEEILKLIKEAE